MSPISSGCSFPDVLTVHYSSFGSNDEDDFRVVSGILRLSTKYLIDSLRAKALAHLSTAWPSDLKTWDAREDVMRGFEMEGNPQRYPHPFVRSPDYMRRTRALTPRRASST